MQTQFPMKISRYLRTSPELAAVTRHAEQLLALQNLFEAAAPPGLARHCRVANYKQGVLIIHAANALLAAKLRQVVPSLTDEFCNRGWQITAIQVAVQDRAEASRQTAEAVEPLPASARAGLAAFARMATDQRLKQAVEHLLQHAAPAEDPPANPAKKDPGGS
jgi:hypothetical protein